MSAYIDFASTKDEWCDFESAYVASGLPSVCLKFLCQINVGPLQFFLYVVIMDFIAIFRLEFLSTFCILYIFLLFWKMKKKNGKENMSYWTVRFVKKSFFSPFFLHASNKLSCWVMSSVFHPVSCIIHQVILMPSFCQVYFLYQLSGLTFTCSELTFVFVQNFIAQKYKLNPQNNLTCLCGTIWIKWIYVYAYLWIYAYFNISNF